MKAMLFAAFFVAALAVVTAKSCKSSDECGEKECCAGFNPFRGSCKALTKQGRKCLVDEDVFPFNDIHIVACPCAEELECVADEKSKNKNDGKCQVPATTTAGSSEETTADAGSSEETTADAGSSEETTTADQVSEETRSGSGEVTEGEAETTVDEQVSSEQKE